MSEPGKQKIKLGHWIIDLSSGECTCLDGTARQKITARLEPKACQLLAVLIHHAEQVVSKEQLIAQVWQSAYTSDDTISRTISRLRASLQDDAKTPRYIETVPKRGYRLIAPVTPADELTAATAKPASFRLPVISAAVCLLLIATWYFWPVDSTGQIPRQRLTEADNFYHQMRLADNEMAISLYQQHLAVQPDSAKAYAGLANATVQKVMRWPEQGGSFKSLTDSVKQGLLTTPGAVLQLRRADSFAQKALALAPDDAEALKARAFVLSAMGQFEQASAYYQQALAQAPDAWPVLLNLAELAAAQADDTAALTYLQQAFDAMSAQYAQHAVQVRPWISDVAALVADKYLKQRDYVSAEQWYRKALSYTPLHEVATLGLASVLYNTDSPQRAVALCEQLNLRLRKNHQCDEVVRLLSD